MSDLIPRLNYYIKNKMDVGPLELEVYRDEIERLTAKCRAANAKQYKARLELKQANAVVEAAKQFINAPYFMADLKQNYDQALAALETDDDSC